jgi:RIO kinase 1
MPRMATSGKEEWKTFASVFDQFTERVLQKLIQKGVIRGLVGPLSMGKEATVFIAERGDGHVVVKIYRLSTCDFNRMYTFIRTDPRFPKLNRQRRKVVFAWAQREFRNLLKAREAGIRVPTPITHMMNVLVMEMIGKPAPKAKAESPKQPKKFIDDVISQMRKLYAAGLVHGDLSPFNILNDEGTPVIIDMSQSTTLDDHNAKEYLARDVRNIVAFAENLGISLTEESVMQKIKNEPKAKT